MNLLDKISVLEAKTVTKKEFELATGVTRAEYLKEMKDFIETERAKAAVSKK